MQEHTPSKNGKWFQRLLKFSKQAAYFSTCDKDLRSFLFREKKSCILDGGVLGWVFTKNALVKTCMSVVTHIASQTPGIFWIPHIRLSNLLQTPIGSPWCLYLNTIVTDCLDPGYLYIQYNLDLPLMLTCAWHPCFHIISCIFLLDLS